MQTFSIEFLSQGTRCAGTLMLPADDHDAPLIIMAHGFGLPREAGLPAFATRFVTAGYAVLLFDYRGFGDSDGSPRHWISPRRHVQDWRAAVAHARTLPLTRQRRIVLWGTSFSGGHALQTAARDAGITAVMTLVPHVSGPASMRHTPALTIFRLGIAGLLDLLGGCVGHPVYRPIVGEPGTLAALTGHGAFAGYTRLLPAQARWENRTRSRVFLALPFYSPMRHAHRIACPVQVIAGSEDTVTPADAARAAAARMPQGRFTEIGCDHFQPFSGECFEQVMTRQLSFLREVAPRHPLNQPPQR